MTFITFMKHWLGEKTTWAGIIILISTFNLSVLTPEQNAALQILGVSLVARNEGKK